MEDRVLDYLLTFFDGFESWKAARTSALESLDPKTAALSRCLYSSPRPFVNQFVKHHISRPIYSLPGEESVTTSAREEFIQRCKIAMKAKFNAFMFPAHRLSGCDLLSDSGTTAMDVSQLAQLMQGDESYGTNEGWIIMNHTIRDVFGKEYGNPFLGLHPDSAINEEFILRQNFVFMFHQGRSAENALFNCILKYLIQRDGAAAAGKWKIGFNSAFDTTAGNIIELNDSMLKDPATGEFVHIGLELHEFLDVSLREKKDAKFLGNCDLDAVRAFISGNHERIPFFYLTITNNKGGGQPVSLAHIRAVSELCHSYNVPLLFDACRFAENAWFIQRDEEPSMSIQEIVHAMFECVDGFHSSFKKDGIVNMGGGLIIKPTGLFAKKFIINGMGQMLTDHQILTEGHPSYGGLCGRDLLVLAKGLRLVCRKEYLTGRIGQVIGFGNTLSALGVPVLQPVGGSAVYIDTDGFFGDEDGTKRDEFFGISLVAILLCFGHRLCELGAFAFSGPTAPCATPRDVPSNFVRAAIPRNLYSSDDLNALALLLAYLHEEKDRIVGVIPLDDCRKLSLHHFKSVFEFKLEKN